MKKYAKVDVSEQTLEDLIRQSASMIEEGLVYIDHQKQAAGGRLDMLLVDSGNSLVVAELKVTQDDGMLMQGVDYYDYVTSHIETYARLYAKEKIDVNEQVRLLLVAPSFSQTLNNRAKWLNLPVSQFTYTCIQIEGETDVIVVFAEREIDAMTPAQTESGAGVYTLSDHLDDATDAHVRDRITRLIDEAKQWPIGHVSVDPIKHSLSFKVNGHWFAYLDVRRRHFLVGINDDDETFKSFPVKSDEEFDNAVQKMKTSARRVSV